MFGVLVLPVLENRSKIGDLPVRQRVRVPVFVLPHVDALHSRLGGCAPFRVELGAH